MIKNSFYFKSMALNYVDGRVVIGVGSLEYGGGPRFRILGGGGARFRIYLGAKGGEQIPIRHMTS